MFEHEEVRMRSRAQSEWDHLHAQMWKLEEAMRASCDEATRASLRAQWRVVIMALSELEEEHGGFTFSQDVDQTDRERSLDAA